MIDWQNTGSKWHAHPSNHRLKPGGTEYERYLWVRGQIEPGSRVLDVGCNCGQFAVNLTRDIQCAVVGVDIVQDFVDHCRREKSEFGEFHWFDFSRVDLAYLDQLGLEPDSFDAITALEVIEHPICVRGFVENVFTLLRPGGRLIVTTPHHESTLFGYDYMRSHAHHVRMWSPWRLEQVFGEMVDYTEIMYKGRLAQIGAVFERAGES